MRNLGYIVLITLLTAGLLSACSDNEQAPQAAIQEADSTAEASANVTIDFVVETQAGAVRGELTSEGGVSAKIFRGIPYAEPPLGDLRWQPPQSALSWSGVRDAIEWPDRCPQRSSSMGTGIPISEDCLYLNLVTAAQTANDELPVMVFFHGGGLTIGTGNSDIYNHPTLPSKGIVLVTVNSRLGPMGYLAHPALSSESAHGVSGNYGTLDLKASLEWVQENIRAFGGDPNNVTIFGESGGGTKTISQMSSPLTEGLFHKAIVESGSGLVAPNRATFLEDAEAIGQKLAGQLGIENSGNVLAAMRAVSWEDIIAAAASDEVGFSASVVVDGYVIPDTVNALFNQGRQRDIPLIVGANTGERSLQTSVPLMANIHSRTASSDTFVYNFSHLPKTWREEPCIAFHGLELPYVFGSVPVGIPSPTILFLSRGGGCESREIAVDEIDLSVADNTSTLWAQFAKTGNPSVEGMAEWPTYTEQNNQYLDIGATLEAKAGIENAYVTPPGN